MASSSGRLAAVLGLLCAGLACTAYPATPPATAPTQPANVQPVTIVPANGDEATVQVLLTDPVPETVPVPGDFEAGLLASTQEPALRHRPSVTLVMAPPPDPKAKDYRVTLRISGLMAFGEFSVPLFYKGRPIETQRFLKPGLIVRSPAEGSFVAREGEPFVVVLENPSGSGDVPVRARLSFGGKDVCRFTVENFASKAAAPANEKDKPAAGCETYASWTEFSVPRYARVTLAATPAAEWFRNADSQLAQGGKRTGLLTLRFQNAGVIHEQNLPLEVEMRPGRNTLFCSLAVVALLLLAGAVLSLALRVSVPNIARKRQLRDRLREEAKLTASISTEVDSNLRVLLRVERLALDEIRRAGWVFGPGYVDVAKRVDQALPALKRRIEAVRRLDVALIQRRILMEQGAAPTRLEQIETLLASASETLKQDHLSDEEWVFVDQRLESAERALSEPTQTEKDAFESLLQARWKAVRDHFGIDAATGELIVPPILKELAACFPGKALLPKAADADGSQWIRAVGPVRADLQLSALMLLWEFQFLAPANAASGPWAAAKARLNQLLATPAVDNLREARSLLRQLAEGLEETDIVSELKAGNAEIVIDPPEPRPNQKVRFAIRFRRTRVNSAAARDLITCRWCFHDRRKAPNLGAAWRFVTRGKVPPPDPVIFEEDGWYAHHYFEKDVDSSTISVAFFGSKGDAIDIQAPAAGAQTAHWSRREKRVQVSRHSQETWTRAGLEVLQLAAALLIPLATLASTTLGGGGFAHWWELVAIGFASDTIKSILVGRQDSSTGP